jgi:putative Mg2+ transporter-C (MgtC) family protein
MTELSAELLGAPILSWPVLLVRLGGATLLCALIGLEREVKNRPAGLRTHILVGLASAVYTLIMVELVSRAGSYSDTVRTDPIRIIEAVTSGVAFLAAGMIIFTGDKVRGLTTGAGLWLSASVGLAAGLGLWPLATLSTALALIVTRLLGSVERRGEKALTGRRSRDDDAPGR